MGDDDTTCKRTEPTATCKHTEPMPTWTGEAPPFYPSSSHTAETREKISEIIPRKLYLTNRMGVAAYDGSTTTLGPEGNRTATHIAMLGCELTVPGVSLSTWQKDISEADDEATIVSTLSSGVHFIHNAISDDISAFAHNGNHDVHKGGGCVIVLCPSGISRSTSLILAYLMMHSRMSLFDAFAHVYQKRPCIWPSRAFMNALLQIEKATFGKNTLNAKKYAQWAEWEGPSAVQPTGARRMSLSKAELAQLEELTHIWPVRSGLTWSGIGTAC